MRTSDFKNQWSKGKTEGRIKARRGKVRTEKRSRSEVQERIEKEEGSEERRD